MAVDQPPVEADLSGFVDDAATGQAATEFWRNVLPWDDLNAKSPPGHWLEFQRDIIPTLAVLVAGRGPVGPRLVAGDAAGRIQTTANPFFADLLTAQVAQNANLFPVADTSLYSVGMFIYVPDFGPGGAGNVNDYLGRIDQVAQTFGLTSGQLKVFPGAGALMPAGTPFLAIGPPPTWLPAAPWTTPIDVPVVPVARVGIGTTHVVAAVAGQKVYVFTGNAFVSVVAAAAAWELRDSAGNLRWTGHATVVGDFPFDLRGAAIGPIGTGLDVAVSGGAATVTLMATTSQR